MALEKYFYFSDSFLVSNLGIALSEAISQDCCEGRWKDKVIVFITVIWKDLKLNGDKKNPFIVYILLF